MTTLGIIGPQGSNTWQAAHSYKPEAQLISFPHHAALARAFAENQVEMMILPVYNTRMGGVLRSFQVMEKMKNGHWIDNIVQPIHLSLGTLNGKEPLKVILGTSHVIHQCEDYLTDTYPDISLLTVTNLDQTLTDIKAMQRLDHGVIEAEELLKDHGLTIREREIAPHNKTRYAVIGRTPAPATGYDATSILTVPLKDRVGMLFDTLGAFTQRGINILDMRAESNAKTQELQIFIEAEGHADDPLLQEALASLEQHVIQESDCLKVLGSYRRVDMRVKRIKTFGFIGTGEMSAWFARKLENEGYQTLLTGRSTTLRPEEMIPQVDVVVLCVPISHTSATIAQYGGFLKAGQALILLAGEAEDTLNTALAHTSDGVELMLVHNLWGPAALTMKDKNASVVRTPRSGALCTEFEAFLYKHGAAIYHDSPQQHDLLMGVGQKLPTTISVALAMALADNKIKTTDIASHATLTSLYAILAMARVHNQNPRTYAEIMATKGEGRKIVRSFAENILKIMEMAEQGEINALCAQIEAGSRYLTQEFLDASMKQSLAVDKVLGRLLKQ
jgi:prephenate dehydratase/prephenate dehydrogenase